MINHKNIKANNRKLKNNKEKVSKEIHNKRKKALSKN